MTSRYDSTYKSIAALIIFAHSRIHQAKPGMAGKVRPPPPGSLVGFQMCFLKIEIPLVSQHCVSRYVIQWGYPRW